MKKLKQGRVIGMSKAYELLKKSFEYLDLLTMKLGEEYPTIDTHMEDIRNYLTRKDNLIVGSEWVCDVSCYVEIRKVGACVTAHKGFYVYVKEIGKHELVFEYNDKVSEYIIPINQFLACFSPK